MVEWKVEEVVNMFVLLVVVFKFGGFLFCIFGVE